MKLPLIGLAACLASVVGCNHADEPITGDDEAALGTSAAIALVSATLPSPIDQGAIDPDDLTCPLTVMPRVALFDIDVRRGNPSVSQIRRLAIQRLIDETGNDGDYALGAFCQKQHPNKTKAGCASLLASARPRAKYGGSIVNIIRASGDDGPTPALEALVTFIEDDLGPDFEEREARHLEIVDDDPEWTDPYHTTMIFDANATRVLLVHWDTSGSC